MAVADRLAAADYTQLKVSLDEKILTVRINRPEVLGALSPEVIHELRDVFAALRPHSVNETMRSLTPPTGRCEGFISPVSGSEFHLLPEPISQPCAK